MKTLSSLLLDSSLTASSCDNDSSDMQADQNPNEPTPKKPQNIMGILLLLKVTILLTKSSLLT